MTLIVQGEEWDFSVTEWWDQEGNYYEGEPTESQLLDAGQLTGHYVDEDDRDRYMTFISEDGWTYDELLSEFQEWYQEGTE